MFNEVAVNTFDSEQLFVLILVIMDFLLILMNLMSIAAHL